MFPAGKPKEPKKAKEPRPEFPFARAKVERILKEHCPGNEVSPRVKMALNHWLGDMASRVSKGLAQVSHRTITEEDFRNAVAKYGFTGSLHEQKEKIGERMEKLNSSVEKFKGEVEESIIYREQEQDLIFGRVRDQFGQDEEYGIYVKEAEPEPKADEAGTE